MMTICLSFRNDYIFQYLKIHYFCNRTDSILDKNIISYQVLQELFLYLLNMKCQNTCQKLSVFGVILFCDVYMIQVMHELWIKNRSERDLCSCEGIVAKKAQKKKPQIFFWAFFATAQVASQLQRSLSFLFFCVTLTVQRSLFC